MKTIVLTGGPRAGKTTVLSYLKKHLPEHKVTPITVPEVATMVFSSGIQWNEISKEEASLIEFQAAMIQLQNEIEYYYRSMARSCKSSQKVIICDRGSVDNLAYIPESLWPTVFYKLDISSIVSLLMPYDYLIHLETSAYGNDYDANRYDNSVRHEDSLAAIRMDAKLRYIWTMGDWVNNTVIPYNDDFEQKCKDVLETVLEVI